MLETAALGCVAAGGLGAAVRLVSGGSAQEAVRDAAIGCVAGGVVGAAAGAYVDARAQSFANEEARLAALQDAARTDVAHYRQLNAATQTLIDEERARVAAAAKDQGAAKTAVEDRERRRAQQEETIALLEAQRDELKGNVATMAQDEHAIDQQGANTQSLKNEANALEKEREELDSRIVILKDIYGKPA